MTSFTSFFLLLRLRCRQALPCWNITPSAGPVNMPRSLARFCRGNRPGTMTFPERKSCRFFSNREISSSQETQFLFPHYSRFRASGVKDCLRAAWDRRGNNCRLSLRERCGFRGAKGNNATVIDSPVLGVHRILVSWVLATSRNTWHNFTGTRMTYLTAGSAKSLGPWFRGNEFLAPRSSATPCDDSLRSPGLTAVSRLLRSS